MKNYYSAATLWSTTEFPKKRKVRDEEPAVELEQSKWRREEERGSKGGDWFIRREESMKGWKQSSISSKNERKPLEEKIGNIDTEAGASYSYRAPYQDDGQGVKDNMKCEGSPHFPNRNFAKDVGNSNENPSNPEKIPIS